ncbi:MAG: hypothetical protein K0B16_15075 [Burkholderiaceae bacterium]|nr:hypothetical protein [Burkholderiaceae bacterium]
MKAPVNRNARNIRHGSNTSRPNGASVSALSFDTRDLFIAALEGNCETALTGADAAARDATVRAFEAYLEGSEHDTRH